MPNLQSCQNYRNPFPTTDIIIEYRNCVKQGIVLIRRKNPPYGMAIPGGFAECGISLEDNARKEAREETGLEIIIENPGRPYVYSEPERDSRGHMISNTYYAKGYGTLLAGDDAKAAALYSIGEVIELIRKDKLAPDDAKIIAFDHAHILEDYLRNKGYLA
jgi:ADP-ribose pyrophosphatase YjhB (NUDIX family)